MRNIHILGTDKPTFLHKSTKTGILRKSSACINDMKQAQGMNIYITSDEEIKEENLTKSIYVIDVQNGNIGKLTCKNRFFKGSCKLIGIEWSNKQDIWNYYHIKEIILTTDQDLIKDGVQSITDEFLEWFVKNPSCESVEIEYLVPKVDNPFQQGILNGLAKSYPDIVKKPYIIIPKEDFNDYHYKETFESRQYYIPKEEPKQETLEEAVNAFKKTDVYINEIKQKQERMYSEEEVKKLLIKCKDRFGGSDLDDYVEDSKVIDWFEKFKKK